MSSTSFGTAGRRASLLLAVALLSAHPVKAEIPAEKTSPIVANTSIFAESRHELRAGDVHIAYTATAGELPIRDASGKKAAKIFYIAYTAGPKNEPSPRPVIFLFNGGPGASSVFLNIGGFGPKRVPTDSPAPAHAAPYVLSDNASSLLDKADLVFLDAMGTGFSKADNDDDNATFWSVDADLSAFAEAIRCYVTQTSRWNAPKYLLGESYGGTRAAALAGKLEDSGMALNGVILLSPILNFAEYAPGVDQGFVNFLPSFAATARYHNKLTNKPADLAGFLAEVRRFALERYLPALQKGDALSTADETAIANALSRYTGLTPQAIVTANLRISVDLFCSQMLLDKGALVGIYDSRATGLAVAAPNNGLNFDPADPVMVAPFTAGFHRVLDEELGVHHSDDYRFVVAGLDQRWDWHHRAPDGDMQTTPDMGLDLAEAMRRNPHLKVQVLHGFFDLGTPFFGTEYDFAHMVLPEALQKNVQFQYYQAGHMLYLNDTVLKQLKIDISRFVDSTIQGR